MSPVFRVDLHTCRDFDRTMKAIRCGAAIALVPIFFSSCAQPSLTGDTVGRAQAGQAQQVFLGSVTSVRTVTIQGNRLGGTLVGAGAGGLIGNQIGSGSGRTAATVGGALVGGAVGSHVGQSATSRQGLEIDVQLDHGSRISVVQEVNPRESFAPGDRVRVISGGGRTRVSQ